jgi:cytosine/adenosine deaminase-related metal-dependent hydrolase
MGMRTFDLTRLPLEPVQLRAARSARDLLAALDGGITSVREVGGTNGAELAHLVHLGLTPLAAIEAATAVAPLTLGPQAPRSGQLAAGYDADVITLTADPVADIAVLTHPDNVVGVWTGGRQVKGSLAA